MSERIGKINQVLKQIAAEFLSARSNKKSLITVTNTSTSPDLKNVTVYVTVLPMEYEAHALEFCNRRAPELRGVLKKKLSIKRIPFVDFKIDQGEKHRQLIDEISRSAYNDDHQVE